MEMVLAIVIIGVALAGVLSPILTSVRGSADPMIRKQMLAVAEEMMEEVLLKPYAVSGTAPTDFSVKSCGVAALREAFDDVSDYGGNLASNYIGYQTTGICDIDGTAVTGLETYDVAVTVNPTASLGSLSSNVKKVTVTVTHGSDSVVLIGWRTDYAS